MGHLIVGLAAAELGVSTRTLSRWAQRGVINSTLTNGGWRLYDWDEVQELKRKLASRRREA